MEIFKKNISLDIYTKYYGKVKVFLNDNDNKIGNGYFVIAKKGKKRLSGFVNYRGEEIIPLQEMELEDLFGNQNYHDICLGFQIPKTDILKYYHLKETEDKSYEVCFCTDPFDQIPIEVRRVEYHPEVWIFETMTDIPTYAIYSVSEKCYLTNYFHEISFNLDENPYHHYAYFRFDLYDYHEGDYYNSIVYTSLCGFIDENGAFSSQILDTEDKLLYDSFQLGENSCSKEFQVFCNCLYKKYEDRYHENKQNIKHIMNNLFNQYNQSNCENAKKNIVKTKIIPFQKREEK